MTAVDAPVRDFIQKVRECKSAAEERTLVAAASASIRTALKEGSEFRFRNMVKLLYIHMLGYPTHWAQMEVLTLIHLTQYADKRAGYLALSLLLDEKSEILLLATNSIIHDLDDSRAHVQVLALNALANIANETQARAAAPTIEKLIVHKKGVVRKKAIHVATRIVSRVPELAEGFADKVKALLGAQGQDNGTVLAVVELMLEICRVEPSAVARFKKYVPKFVSALKKLTRSRAMGPDDFDVHGVRDPFLQVALFRLIRLLARDEHEASAKLSDVLASVATNTDRAHNVGNAILLEGVHTTLELARADAELRAMAVNVLGKFLTNPDNNVRYVALDICATLVNDDMDTVQRYRDVFMDCLHDADAAIRRKAIVLLYALVDSENVRSVVRELLRALAAADSELRQELTHKLCFLTDKYAPTPAWHVDTMLKILATPGITNFFPELALNQLMALVARTPEVQVHAVQRMWLALKDTPTQPLLMTVCLWCVGEFGDLLVAQSLDGTAQGRVEPEEVIALLETLLGPHQPEMVRQHALTAAMKLTTRFPPQHRPRLVKLVEGCKGAVSTELQSRALEYSALWSAVAVDQLQSILGRMPAAQVSTLNGSHTASTTQKDKVQSTISSAGDLLGSLYSSNGSHIQSLTTTSASTSDLLGGVLSSPQPSDSPSSSALLGDLLGGASGLPGSSEGAVDPLAALMGPNSPLNALAASYTDGQSLTAYQSDTLSVSMTFKKPQSDKPQYSLINLVFTNTGDLPLDNFAFQTAPPKHLKFVVSPLSTASIAPRGGTATAMIKAANSAYGDKGMAMKMRISYTRAGVPVHVEEVVKGFPAGL